MIFHQEIIADLISMNESGKQWKEKGEIPNEVCSIGDVIKAKESSESSTSDENYCLAPEVNEIIFYCFYFLCQFIQK